MKPYKLLKAECMIKKAKEQLANMSEESPATVTRGNKTYQIYTKPLFGQSNQGELYVVEGEQPSKLRYTLCLNEKMQLTMIIDGQKKAPLVIGDYERGGALGFQSKRLESLLNLAVPTSKTQTKANNMPPQPTIQPSAVIKKEAGTELDAETLFNSLEYDLYALEDNRADELETKWFQEDPLALVSLIANTPKTKLKQLAESVKGWKKEDKLLLAAICMVPEENGKSIPGLDLFACHVMGQINSSDGSPKQGNGKIALELFTKIKHPYGTNQKYGEQFKQKLQELQK
jgi:hypothetical protein